MRFTPKGRSVSAWIAATLCCSSCVLDQLIGVTPSPPALETAATSSGVTAPPIGASTTGTSIRSRSVRAVRTGSSSHASEKAGVVRGAGDVDRAAHSSRRVEDAQRPARERRSEYEPQALLDVVRAARDRGLSEQTAVEPVDVERAVVSARHIRIATLEGHVLRRRPCEQALEDPPGAAVVDRDRATIPGGDPDMSHVWHESHVMQPKRRAYRSDMPWLQGARHVHDRELTRLG